MDQFTVPQFIDVEDKIFGPVTTRQFIIMLAGGLLIFLSYRYADFFLFVFLLILIGGFTLILAFVKINGQSFHYFLLNLVQTVRRPSRRVWNKIYTDTELKEIVALQEKPEEIEKPTVKRAAHTKIRDLSLLVNTGGYYKGD